jgi:hypothetical protein
VSERAMLMQLVGAAEPVEPDWQDALRRAGYLGRHFPRRRQLLRPRRVLVLVAVALAVTYAVAAVAADSPRVGPAYWLFDRSGETYPVNQVPTLSDWVFRKRGTLGWVPTNKERACIAPLREVGPRAGLNCADPVPEVAAVPVLQGSVAGHRFEMSALVNEEGRTVGPMAMRTRGRWRGVSFGFSGGGPAEPTYGTKVPSVGSSGLAPVRGLPQLVPPWAEPPEADDLHWLSLTLSIPQRLEASGGGTGPKWLFGVANPRVTRIDLKNENDGTVVSVPTFDGPDQSPLRLRLWVAVLRLDQLVHTVVPRDRDGDALEQWRLQIAM